MIHINLKGNEGAAMRLGILLTRIERKETIESYPISDYEIERLPTILKEIGKGYFYKIIPSIAPPWSFFTAKYIGEINPN